MQAGKSRAPRKWYSNGRWSVYFTLIALLLILIGFALRGTIGIWLIYASVPLIIVCIGYFSLVQGKAQLMGWKAYDEWEESGSSVCPKCGRTTVGGDFCKHCGARLDDSESG